MATKKQKQLLLANGFLAGLAACGVDELNSSNLSFELPFVKAWRQWSAGKPADVLPRVEYGGTDQPRNILFRVQSSNSPFKDFRRDGITDSPHGLTPHEFLEVYCDEFPVDDWLELAKLFLQALDSK